MSFRSSSYRLLEALSDGQFHSGTELSELLGISRAAISKQVQRIRSAYGLTLFSVPGKGYRLPQPMVLLNREEICRQMGPAALALLAELELLDQVDSTSSYLAERSKTGIASGHACLAERQTAGRGRRGREWISPFGANIYLSVFWRSRLTLPQLSGLSLALGAAVVSALKTAGCRGIGLKWPNDILVDGKKAAGLLLEVSGEQNGPADVILGLGLNMYMQKGDCPINQPWTNVAAAFTADSYDRNQLAGIILDALLTALQQYDREGLAPGLVEWRKHDLFHGRAVRLHMADSWIEGIYQGVDDNGALLLRHHGDVRAYHGGEVSLRPAE